MLFATSPTRSHPVPLTSQPNMSVPIEVSTLSGAVIDAGISVVIFIWGGLAKLTGAKLLIINPARARVNNCFVFILFSHFSINIFVFQVMAFCVSV
jgi:hypothetical protein